MTIRLTPERYMKITGKTPHQVYMKIYLKKYREDNKNRLRTNRLEYFKQKQLNKIKASDA